MRHVNLSPITLAVGLAAVPLASPSGAAAQAVPAVGHSIDVSRSRASLRLDFSDDSRLTVLLAGGRVLLNGREAARYQSGGPLERAWRGLLGRADSLSTADLVAALKEWKADNPAEGDASAFKAIDAALKGLTVAPPSAEAGLTVAPGAPGVPLTPPAPPVGPGPEVFRENLRESIRSSVRQSIEEARRATSAARRMNPNPQFTPRDGGNFAGVGPNLAGLLGAFVALASIAFGLLSFAPRQLDIVARTVQSSFVRSFFAGLFAQPLILPVLGMLVVGLVLTVVGILVVPVAVVAFALALILAVIGGYVAAARALGELYVRRRMAQGALAGGDTPYRAILIGLAGQLAIWTPFALLGWVPAAGSVLLWTALVFTWLMATVGLGATILSRGGLRGTFGRQVTPELSGEISWSTVDEIAPSKPVAGGPVS